MNFKKYHHIEKLGHEEVEDILEGIVNIYPKLDGTNASIWLDENGTLQAGSRNRQLTLEQDNAGFLNWVKDQKGLEAFLNRFPGMRLYGEWLVPHSLKTYRDDAWKRFWVFDCEINGILYPAERMSEEFERFNIDFITPLAMIENPSEEQLIRIMNETNTFLIEDGAGPGEGIVIKQYGEWRNRFGDQVWAKMVRNEFKEMNKKSFGLKVTKGEKQVEVEIVNEFVTDALVKKELAKIVHELADQNKVLTLHDSEDLKKYYNQVMTTNRKQLIPRLLQTVFYCLIKEEMWSIVKKFKNPTVDFAKLNRLTIIRTKELAPEIF